MKLPPGSEEAAYCHKYCQSITDVSRIQFLDVGPRLVRTSIKKFHRSNYVLPWQTFMPVCWWETYTLIIPNEDFYITRDMYAIHFWNEIWRYHGYDKNRTYPETSIFEQFKTFFHVGARDEEE
jgi:hypothetical protein